MLKFLKKFNFPLLIVFFIILYWCLFLPLLFIYLKSVIDDPKNLLPITFWGIALLCFILLLIFFGFLRCCCCKKTGNNQRNNNKTDEFENINKVIIVKKPKVNDDNCPKDVEIIKKSYQPEIYPVPTDPNYKCSPVNQQLTTTTVVTTTIEKSIEKPIVKPREKRIEKPIVVECTEKITKEEIVGDKKRPTEKLIITEKHVVHELKNGGENNSKIQQQHQSNPIPKPRGKSMEIVPTTTMTTTEIVQQTSGVVDSTKKIKPRVKSLEIGTQTADISIIDDDDDRDGSGSPLTPREKFFQEMIHTQDTLDGSTGGGWRKNSADSDSHKLIKDDELYANHKELYNFIVDKNRYKTPMIYDPHFSQQQQQQPAPVNPIKKSPRASTVQQPPPPLQLSQQPPPTQHKERCEKCRENERRNSDKSKRNSKDYYVPSPVLSETDEDINLKINPQQKVEVFIPLPVVEKKPINLGYTEYDDNVFD